MFELFPKPILIFWLHLLVFCRLQIAFQNFDLSTVLLFGKDLNVAKMAKFVLDQVENIAGKGENADYQHFLLFPTMFSASFFLEILKISDRGVE